MGQPIVHFEVIGQGPRKVRSFYGDLFEWEVDTNATVAEDVSQRGDCGLADRNATPEGVGIPGGVGGGVGYAGHAILYVGVPGETALKKAERLGGSRVMGPGKNPGKVLVVAHFADAEGNSIGLAGPA